MYPRSCAAAEPSLVLSPDCKHLAVKEPCSRRICLLSAQDGFKEVLTTLEPLPVARDGDVVADTVLSCSWSADSKLLLVACKSSAVYLFDRCALDFGAQSFQKACGWFQSRQPTAQTQSAHLRCAMLLCALIKQALCSAMSSSLQSASWGAHVQPTSCPALRCADMPVPPFFLQHWAVTLSLGPNLVLGATAASGRLPWSWQHNHHPDSSSCGVPCGTQWRQAAARQHTRQ